MQTARMPWKTKKYKDIFKMDLLNLVICGSVDDGKSSLLGRILYETDNIPLDKLQSLIKLTEKFGTNNENLDLALLTDSLQSEQEQGITIDVAYRFFAYKNRKFIVADTPGHEEYTRNNTCGASNADCAILLIDASRNITTQTMRHLYILNLMRVKNLVICVNKMDKIVYSQEIFEKIIAQIQLHCNKFEFESVYFLPISARNGENITKNSDKMPWNKAKNLMDYLLELKIPEENSEVFRFWVQRTIRPNENFRGYAGMVNNGAISVGDEVVIMPSHHHALIKEIWQGEKQLPSAHKGQSVILVLNKDIDISRGSLIVNPNFIPNITNYFKGYVINLNNKSITENYKFMLKIGALHLQAEVKSINYRINMQDFYPEICNIIQPNEIAFVEIFTHKSIPIDNFKNIKSTGNFIMIDLENNDTIGAGIIETKILNQEKQNKSFLKKILIIMGFYCKVN